MRTSSSNAESAPSQSSAAGPSTLSAEPEPNDMSQEGNGSENVDFLNDGDSALDQGSVTSSTTSIDSSISKFKENNRLYHSFNGKICVLPIDKEELLRQNIQQHLLYDITLKKLSFAPFKNIHRVLDIGTGTGTWAIDFADEHPEAEIVGIDLAFIQTVLVPPNLRFEIDDLEEDWTFRMKFDYIHSAMMAGTFADWQKFYQQAFAGWLEIQDIYFPIRCDDNSMPSDCSLVRWCDLMMKAATKLGQPLDSCARAKGMMEAAGFVDIVQIPFKWPQNPWPREKKYKELGMWVQENFATGIEAMSLALFTRVLGWSKDEVTVFLAEVKHDMRNRSIHAYWPLQVVYGRRP